MYANSGYRDKGDNMESVFRNSIGMTMILIKPGEFLMGSDVPPAKFDEIPVHKVKISQHFYISETEVTIEQFQQFKPEFNGSSYFDPLLRHMRRNTPMAFKWSNKITFNLAKLQMLRCHKMGFEWQYHKQRDFLSIVNVKKCN